MTSSPSLCIQRRPEKELDLTKFLGKVRSNSDNSEKFPIGTHMGFEFFITIQQLANGIKPLKLYVTNLTEDSKQREWKLGFRVSFDDGFSSEVKTMKSSESDREFKIAVATPTHDVSKLDIRIWVQDCWRKFDDPNYSDASILVDGEEFMVSKLFLSSQCTFFDSAFKWAAEQGKEPKITEDTFYPYEVQNFLEMIHGEIITNDDSIESLLEMSCYFGCATGIRRCIQFLMNTDSVNWEKIFDLGEKYGVSEIKKLCIKSVPSVERLVYLLPVDRSKLDKDDLSLFLDQFLMLDSLAKQKEKEEKQERDRQRREEQQRDYDYRREVAARGRHQNVFHIRRF